MTIEKLRRYTCIDELFSMLNGNVITFNNQAKWDDTNDVCYISKFKTENKYKSVLVKCFAEAEETFLMWKAYTEKEKGVCIEFDENNLKQKISSSNVVSGFVNYPTIETRQTERVTISELPFLKRYPYRGEKEYRFIYFSKEKVISTINIPIDRSCISRVLLNPWINEKIFKTCKEEIKKISGWEDLVVLKSSVLSNKDWKDAVDNLE